jgi:Ca2+-binding RTX toxin-like protein
MGNQQNATDFVFGSASEAFVSSANTGAICGSNSISSGSGNDVIAGSVGVNWDYAYGGNNVIYAGSGSDTIYGDCSINSGVFRGGHNTIYGGSGCDVICGDCNTNNDFFVGGHNTIHAGSGNATRKAAKVIAPTMRPPMRSGSPRLERMPTR